MRGLLDGLLDLIFPPRCAVCRAATDEPICPDCLGALPYCEAPLCARCGAPTVVVAAGCPECRHEEWAFENARALGYYRDGLKECVQAIKYRNRSGLVGLLAAAAAERQGDFLSGADMLTFVPLSARRQSERGFNQAQALARALAELTGLDCRGLLERTRHTADQNSLPADKRPGNVRDAFAPKASSGPSISGAHVVLVDDVLTTGSTASDCARALIAAGAGRVGVFTLARTLHRG